MYNRMHNVSRKPTFWAPDSADDYNCRLHTVFETAGRMSITDITDKIGGAAHEMGRPRRPLRAQGYSPLGDKLRATLRSATSMAEERTQAVADLWASRHRFAAENMASASMHVFTHLRHGGWGAQHLTSRHSCMPFLLADSGEFILDVGSIQIHSHE